ncbi:MAG: hypothetical protein KAI45_12455, partial [Melioribacteraceae bacterium]|nr:hypothetical protein [Melioribacteraceae bacterium]
MSTNLFGQTISGRFEVIQDTDSKYIGKIQVKLQEGTAIMGNAVIRYKFNPNRLTIPENPEEGTDYKIYNFQSTDYVSSVSHPSEDVLSINIVKLFGSDISLTDQYLDVAEVTFSVKNPNESNEFQSDIIQFFQPLSSDMWEIGDWVVYQGGKSFEFMNLVSPEDGSEDLPATITLKWNNVEGAEKYNLEVSKDEAFTDLIYNNSEIADTAKRLTLEYDTQYFWRVRYSNSDGISPYSGKYSFTTIKPVPKVVLSSPVNDSTILGTSLWLKWKSVSDRDFYQLQVSKNSDFSDIAISMDDLQINEIEISDLEIGYEYYWRARASINNVFGEYSNTNKFSTYSDVPKVVLRSPVNDSTILGTSVWLKWESVSGRDYYQMQLATDNNFTNIVEFLDTLHINEILVDNLIKGQDYYWRARASKYNYFGEYSITSRFYTAHGDTTKPVLLAPANDAMDV